MAPLVGTLDSERTQKVMEGVLERIVQPSTRPGHMAIATTLPTNHQNQPWAHYDRDDTLSNLRDSD